MIETVFMILGSILIIALLGAFIVWILPILFQIIVTAVMLVVVFFNTLLELFRK